MTAALLNRREMIALTAASAFAGAAGAGSSQSDGGAREDVSQAMACFVADYLQVMNAPAVSLGVTTRDNDVMAAAYGFVDVAARIPASATQLFQIGSITKSFAALVILQLQDEDKLDVAHSVLRYLPSLPVELDYGDITIHQLLTHTAGMPNQAPIFPAESAARVRQGAAPGSEFHYSNWGYNVLGRIIETLDGCSWGASVTRRLLVPLGMKDTVATIDSSSRPRIAPSYQPVHDDRPYPRHGALTRAGNLTFVAASGSIASTPADMNRYMRMLLNRGLGPAGRILSEQSFAAFATGYVGAAELGPHARYGYGVAVESCDGHTCLRHTGGMPSFMSSMQLDIESGVGSFAAINAYQGYRPNAITLFGLRLARAGASSRSPVIVPRADEWPALTGADDYAGEYIAPDGQRLWVTADQAQLWIRSNGAKVLLEYRGTDEFVTSHPQFARFPVQFGRDIAAAGKTGAVVEINYGPRWFAHARFKGDRSVPASAQLAAFAGHYEPEDASLLGVLRIIERRGRLWLGGVTPLESIGGQRYRLTSEPGNTEVLEFRAIIDGQAQVVVWNSLVARRIVVEEPVVTAPASA